MCRPTRTARAELENLGCFGLAESVWVALEHPGLLTKTRMRLGCLLSGSLTACLADPAGDWGVAVVVVGFSVDFASHVLDKTEQCLYGAFDVLETDVAISMTNLASSLSSLPGAVLCNSPVSVDLLSSGIMGSFRSHISIEVKN